MDDAHAPFADLLEELVGSDLRAEGLVGRPISRSRGCCGRFQETLCVAMSPQQPLNALANGVVSTAGPVKVAFPSRPGWNRAGLGKYLFDRRNRGHGNRST